MRRKLRRYGIEITDIGANKYYGLIIQEFPRLGKPHQVENYIVGRSELWREVRDRLRGSLGVSVSENPTILEGELVIINDGVLPRQAFKGLRRLVSSHNRAVDKERKARRKERVAISSQ